MYMNKQAHEIYICFSNKVEEKFGGLDILVSNAAVNPGVGPVLDVIILLWYDCILEVQMLIHIILFRLMNLLGIKFSI